MYQYKIYGLNISSSRNISLLTKTNFSQTDLTVNWNVSTLDTPDNSLEWKPFTTEFLDKINEISIWQIETEKGLLTKVCFVKEENKNINFLLDESREKLRIYHHEKEPESDLESFFVGPVLGFVLRLRGAMCLHSSVVGIAGKAIAFLGHATAGKSTIAAGMANAGAEILADDAAVLTVEDDKFIVQSGYAKIRLRQKAAEFLTDNPEDLPIVYSTRESRYLSLENGNNFHSGSLPLAAIYILGEVSDDYKKPFIKPIKAQEKLMNLIKNTLGNYVVSGDLRAKEFEVLSRIAQTIPMRKLHYAHDIKTLPKQCELIVKDFYNIVGLI